MITTLFVAFVALVAVVVLAVLVLYPMVGLPFYSKMYGEGHLRHYYREKNKKLDAALERMMGRL